jgi:hypothetical protein
VLSEHALTVFFGCIALPESLQLELHSKFEFLALYLKMLPIFYVGKIPINRYILAETDGLIRFDQFARADISLVYQTP